MRRLDEDKNRRSINVRTEVYNQRSHDINEFQATIKGIFESIVILDNQELDDVAKKYSRATDAIIVEGIREGYNFVGGRFRIGIIPRNTAKFEVSAEIYFQDKQNNWIKKSNVAELNMKKLTIEARKELENLGEIYFQVEEPNIR